MKPVKCNKNLKNNTIISRAWNNKNNSWRIPSWKWIKSKWKTIRTSLSKWKTMIRWWGNRWSVRLYRKKKEQGIWNHRRNKITQLHSDKRSIREIKWRNLNSYSNNSNKERQCNSSRKMQCDSSKEKWNTSQNFKSLMKIWQRNMLCTIRV